MHQESIFEVQNLHAYYREVPVDKLLEAWHYLLEVMYTCWWQYGQPQPVFQRRADCLHGRCGAFTLTRSFGRRAYPKAAVIKGDNISQCRISLKSPPSDHKGEHYGNLFFRRAALFVNPGIFGYIEGQSSNDGIQPMEYAGKGVTGDTTRQLH